MLARLAIITLAAASLSFCVAEPEDDEAEADTGSDDFVVRSAPTEDVEVEPLPLEPPPAAEEPEE